MLRARRFIWIIGANDDQFEQGKGKTAIGLSRICAADRNRATNILSSQALPLRAFENVVLQECFHVDNEVFLLALLNYTGFLKCSSSFWTSVDYFGRVEHRLSSIIWKRIGMQGLKNVLSGYTGRPQAIQPFAV